MELDRSLTQRGKKRIWGYFFNFCEIENLMNSAPKKQQIWLKLHWICPERSLDCQTSPPKKVPVPPKFILANSHYTLNHCWTFLFIPSWAYHNSIHTIASSAMWRLTVQPFGKIVLCCWAPKTLVTLTLHILQDWGKFQVWNWMTLQHFEHS